MQSKVKKIEWEINQLKSRFAFLENRLKEIQQQCNHQFEGDSHYQKCVKCKKIEVLYY